MTGAMAIKMMTTTSKNLMALTYDRIENIRARSN